MGDRYGTAVLFSLEKNIICLYARVTFGAAGAPTLDTNNSKGFCNIALKTIAFTGTSSASTSVTSISSFAGLYPGMAVVDSGPTHVNSTIASMNGGADTLTLADAATGTNTGLTASGGQYTLQLGTQAGVRLDSWYKLLQFQYSWDESGSQGTASTLALAPAAPNVFMVGNRTAIRTVPATATSNSTDCTLTFQTGSGAGTSFTAVAPGNGDALRLALVFGNCSAP